MSNETEQPPPISGRQRVQPRLLRFSAVHLLVALGLLFLSAPFVQDLPDGDLLEAVLVTLVMLSAVLAVRARPGMLAIALVLVTPALGGKWLYHFYPGWVSPLIFLIGTMVFFGFIIGNLLCFILRAPRVDTNVLCAGIAGFLMVGFLWVPAYQTVARLNPSAFTFPGNPGAAHVFDGFRAFYFSFITLCTVGYGDITPASKAARMLAVTEALSGMFYMAILISRLVSIYSSSLPVYREELSQMTVDEESRSSRGRKVTFKERTGL